MVSNAFDILLLIARPAAGKSEIIAHLRSTPIKQRVAHYHIGQFNVIDDFPMLWTWFEEDAILTKMGHPRLHTDKNFSFKHIYFWDVLIERINLEYSKIIRDNPDYHLQNTTILEFARGTSQGGFARAFEHLSRDIAEKLAILYVNVSWEESLRKNRARYNPEQPDSILEHGIPDNKMEGLYRHVDWEEITSNHKDQILIQGIPVPFQIFENEDDVTTQGGDALSARLSENLNALYLKYQQKLDSL
jgi:hypothetical protein